MARNALAEKRNMTSNGMTMSTCCAHFYALSVVAQVWGNKIQGQTKSGEQLFPLQNSNSLKVCWSPIGFLQNSLISSGQHNVDY